MLCKTSLSYKFGFTVEGLLGITLDNSQVFLINIHEEVKDKNWPRTTASGSLATGRSTDSPHWDPCTAKPEIQTFSQQRTVEIYPQLQAPVDLSKQNGRHSTGKAPILTSQNTHMESRYTSTREDSTKVESYHQPDDRHKRHSTPLWARNRRKKKKLGSEPPTLHPAFSPEICPPFSSDQNDSEIFAQHNFQHNDDISGVILIKEEDDSESSMDAFQEDEPEIESTTLNKAWTVSSHSKPISIKKTTLSNEIKTEEEQPVCGGAWPGSSPSPHSQVVYEAGTWSEAAGRERGDHPTELPESAPSSADHIGQPENDDPNQPLPPVSSIKKPLIDLLQYAN